MVTTMKEQKPKAIIVGGSIGGTSCAKALMLAGWDVVVLDKAQVHTIGHPTGSALAIDPLAKKIVKSCGSINVTFFPPSPYL